MTVSSLTISKLNFRRDTYALAFILNLHTERVKNDMKQAVKSAQTKKRIASVAIKLFTQKGVEAVTVGEICKKACIAVCTFYYYFNAKEDIYDQIISEAADHMEKAIAAIPPQKSPRDFVTQVFYCYAERNMQMGTDLRTRMQMDLLTSQSGKNANHNKLFHSMDEQLLRFQEEGWIDSDVDIQQFSNNLFIVARGLIFEWCIQNASFDLKERIQEFIFPYVAYYIKEQPDNKS